jgi:hypothetical protein
MPDTDPNSPANDAKFASPGITVSGADNTTTWFRAKARDAAGNVSACSSALRYIEECDRAAESLVLASNPWIDRQEP